MQQRDNECYDVTIIGAGPGGYVAAITAAQMGLTVAVVEQAEVGGTCLNRGCIPTKTLLHTAEMYEDLQHASTFGLSAGHISLDYETLRSRKVQVCNTLRQGVEDLLKANGVKLIRGRGTVASSTQVLIEGCSDDAPVCGNTGTAAGSTHGCINGSASYTLNTKNIIIATGTTPQAPETEGMNLPGVYTSDTILEAIPQLKRLAVIGGGVIGVEFASIYAAYGAEVTLLITSERPLRSLDKELGQSLSMEMKKKGVNVVTRATVQRIETGSPLSVVHPSEDSGSDDRHSGSEAKSALSVVYSSKGEGHRVEVDAVLVAKGRTVNLDGVLAPGLELICEQGCIAVDENMQTSIEGIYAIGDICNAGSQLAHAASAEAMLAVHAIAGKPCTKRLDLIPSCIYTSPEIACVGLTEAEAKEKGIAIKVGKYPMAGNGKTIITQQGRSFIKIVADENEQVIGAQLMCARATDIVGELALGIAAGMTVEHMLQIARPHPSFEEAVGEALEQVVGTSIHSMPRRR